VIHQFCLIGRHSFAGGNSGINKDVPPFIMVFGTPAKTHGINKEGLKRRDFSSEIIRVLRQAYKIIYRKNLTTAKAIAELTELSDQYTEVLQLVNLIQQSTRGIVR
jgi:UDP-N-acetylglucosamine acyltransferase